MAWNSQFLLSLQLNKENDNEKDIYFAGRHAFGHFCW